MQYCNNNKKAIIIVRGNDTDFNNASFLTIRLTTEILDLSTFKAVFKLCNIVKYFNDLSSGEIVINFTATETASLLSECYGTLNLIDTSGKIATIENRIPFEVISVVDGNAIATEPYTLNFDVKQGGENILNISVESAVTVELGTTTTLPAGSDAIVTNSGTFNHLVLNFGIPKGQDGLTPTWGNITGNITEQTDLINLLNEKVDISDFNDLSQTVTDNNMAINSRVDGIVDSFDGDISDLNDAIDNLSGTVSDNYTDLNDKITDNTDDITTIQNTINSYGDIVTYDAAYFATANQGALADTSLQPNDNITLLNNNAGYITSADIPTLADLTTTAQLAAINSGATSTNIGQIATNTQDIADEVTNRQNADNGLQTQIDALVVASDVFDIVGTYAELQAYDISTVPVNDIIKVLVDSTHNDAATYYRCVENNNVKSWSYIGAEGAYYTKSEADNRFVAQTITVNGQPLSSNVTLTAADVGALPDSTVIPTVNNATLTIQKNGTTVDIFTANSSTNTTVNITVPTDTNDLTNGAGYITGITSGDVTTALGYTPYNSSNPNGYISGITSTDVTTALGYTPYNSTNPSGYITSSALTNYVTTNTAQNISGRKTFLGEKAIYFKQSAATDKLGFTLYNPSNSELAALEWRPSTVNGNALLALNCPQAGSNYVGFRYWANINIVAPRPDVNGTYFIPVNITNGNTTVTATSTGTVDISSLMPSLSGYQTTSNLVTSVSSSSTDSQYPSAKLFYDTCGDIETLINAL